MLNAGYNYTYFFPGMQKVVQAAGRVIRTQSDRGIIYLIDDRFARPDVRRLLPALVEDRNVSGRLKSRRGKISLPLLHLTQDFKLGFVPAISWPERFFRPLALFTDVVATGFILHEVGARRRVRYDSESSFFPERV